MFQNIYKLYGRDNAILVIFPADQGFGTDNLFGVCIDNRLVAQVEAFAIVHDAVADHIDSFNGKTLVIVHIVLKNVQLAQMIVLGLVVRKAQARINGFCTDIEFFQVDGARHKRKHHAGSVHIKIMNGIVLDAFVQTSDIFDGRLVAYNGKLGTIHSIPTAHSMGFSLNHSRKFLEHAVSERVTVNFIQARKVINAQDHNLQAFTTPACRLQVFQKAIKASHVGHIVKITQGIVVLDCSAKIVGFPVFISEQHAAAGANNVVTILCLDSVLDIMFICFTTQDSIDAFFISGPIFRMNPFHPGVRNSLHIFIWQTEIANSLFGPAGPIRFHIGDIGICTICKHRKRLKQGIYFRFYNAIHHFLLLMQQRSSCPTF